VNEKLEKIKTELSALTITEMAELKTMLEDSWGVTAAAAAPMMAMPAADASQEAQESTEFDVIFEGLADAGKKIAVIKEVRGVTGLGLKEAKDAVESENVVLKEAVSKAAADEIVKKLSEAGAKIKLKGL
jgi:large subunit ribosomal protein L7/L12